MNYIILDLEWDSAYNKQYSRFINQILQIGAVKLNNKFEIVDIFDKTIKSSFSKKVTSRFTKLTGITTEDMLSGISFEEAVDLYNEWVGSEAVTMTWSNSDLYTIIDNEECLLNGRKFKIEKYLDLQKFIEGEIRLSGTELKNQISLGTAAGMLGISTDNFELHTAKDDSLVCAELLKKCYNKKRFEAMIKDTDKSDFYARLRFKPYFISDITDKAISKKRLEIKCPECAKKAQQETPWKYHNRWFSATFFCNKCGRRLKARVSFKKTFDNIVFKKKILEEKEKQKNEMQSLPEAVQR
ncbi:MAG: exonuclease domain-containing protein [Clostridia bacterium]|nr:exonuclease domain-containing protein [Clostridia bacterium]